MLALARSLGCGALSALNPSTFQSVRWETVSATIVEADRVLLRALRSRDWVEPPLLHFLAATVRTDNRAFLVFGGSQRLREWSTAGVAEELVLGHESGPPAPQLNSRPRQETVQREQLGWREEGDQGSGQLRGCRGGAGPMVRPSGRLLQGSRATSMSWGSKRQCPAEVGISCQFSKSQNVDR